MGSDFGTCSPVKSVSKSHYTSGESSDNGSFTPKLERVHPVIKAIADAFNYETYQLHDRSLSYDGKKAARTAKLAKRMDTIVKPYKFDDDDPITALAFLGQLKRACDSNGVSEGVAMWLLSFFNANSPVA